MKQFQETKKAIHPLFIEVGDFLLDIVKAINFDGGTTFFYNIVLATVMVEI
ncbi:hypothetical protein [Fusobacterium polymorphum]|uniref:hypothetical protein n=1 Tax=Fusobacterium nucleatum subsp. polymorphum TaxID=76857 RepID=UPI00300A3B79